MTFAKKLLTISALVIGIWIVIGVLIYRSTSFAFFSDTPGLVFTETKSLDEEIEACTHKNQKLSPSFWRKVNLYQKEIPDSMSSSISDVVVHSNFTVYQKSNIHFLYTVPKSKKLSVLLLHGQAFSSETWNKLQTIQNIAAFGYYVVAVDLPGFGKTSVIENLNKTEFLNSLISSLHLENVVIVSPSMSGSFSLEYFLQHSSKIAGFIPVSPVNTQVLQKSPCKSPFNYTSLNLDKDCQKVWPYLKKEPPSLNCIKVPTLVVFGEQDKGPNSARLCALPNSQGAEIPLGKHTAYLSNPKLWHTLLYNFLSILEDTFSCI